MLGSGLLTWGMCVSRMSSHLFLRLRPPLRPDRGLCRMTRADQVKQRGFACAVLADDDGDGALEAKIEIVGEKGQTIRIGRAIENARGIEPEPFQIRRGQIDLASLGHPGHAWAIL